MQYNEDYFLERKTALDAKLKELGSKGFRLSILRLAAFVLTAALVFVALLLKNNLIFIPAALVFAAFVFLCVKHGRLNRDLKFSKALSEVNDRYIARFESDFSKLEDKGSEFCITDHDYCVDLDIFGEASLFSLYNVSESAFGRKAFADELLYAHTMERSAEDIKKRTAAVKELSSRPEFLEEYQAVAKIGKLTKMPDALLKLSKNEYVSFSPKTRLLTRLLLLLWIIPAVLLFVFPRLCVPAAMLIIIINLIVSFSLAGKYSECLKAVEGIRLQTEALSSLYLSLEKQDLKDPYLQSLIKGKDQSVKVSEQLKILSGACAWAKVRMQPLIALVLNAVCLYDAFVADKFTSWAERYGKDLEENINALACIESLMCASVVGIIAPQACEPEFIDVDGKDPSNAFFDGKDIAHPLIPRDKVVSNSVKIDGEIALITGSNMSGKTTLIRTIGVCSILAYIGALVPASSLKLGRMRVVSSMRIVDDMKEEMSTFSAELVRISRIVNAGREDHPMLFLIDEIFRGTNSADRTEGAMTVLKILSKPGICGLMTTHDYALCDEARESMQNIAYFHFSETYDDNGIYFDYKLKEGVSNISNAKYLMKLVGIII